MNETERDAIAERAERATPGPPWQVHRAFGSIVSVYAWLDEDRDDPDADAVDVLEEPSRETAEFIAHARSDIPALLAALRAAEERVEEAVGFAQEIADLDSWVGNGVGSTSQEQWQMDTERAIAERARAFLASLTTEDKEGR